MYHGRWQQTTDSPRFDVTTGSLELPSRRESLCKIVAQRRSRSVETSKVVRCVC